MASNFPQGRPHSSHAHDVRPPKHGATAPESSSRVIAAVAVGALLIACMWLADSDLVGDRTQLLAITVALTALGLCGAMLMAGGKPLRRVLAELRLGPWMGVGFAFGYGVATLAWWQGDLDYRGYATSSTLTAGAEVAGLGFMAATAGYLLAPAIVTRWAESKNEQVRGVRPFRNSPLTIWILFGIAMVGQGSRFRSGTVGYLSDPSTALSTTSSASAIFALLAEMGALATLVAAWRVGTTRSPGSIVLLFGVATAQIGLGLFSGSKEDGIVQLIAVVVGLSAGGRLKLRPVLAAAVLTFFVITPVVSAYRQVVVVGSSRLSASQVLAQVNFADVASEAFGGHPTEGSSASNGLSRWSRVGDVAIIANQSPSPIPFVRPEELLAGPVLGFIPRSLWPSKPVLDAGYQVNQVYYHASANIYSSAAPTPYGDLYRHGGDAIVVAGMLLLGGLVRLVDSHESAERGTDPRLLFLPMLLFPTIVKQEIDFMGLTASLPLVAVAYLLASRASATAGTDRR